MLLTRGIWGRLLLQDPYFHSGNWFLVILHSLFWFLTSVPSFSKGNAPRKRGLSSTPDYPFIQNDLYAASLQ